MADTAPEGDQRQTLPLFPLQTVLLPSAHLPLHIFEPRYRQLTADLITGTVPDKRLGIVAIRMPATHEVETTGQVFGVGCAAELREAKRLPDGRFDIVTTGRRRFRLLDIRTDAAPYLVGSIEWLDDDPVPRGADAAITQLSAAARAAHRRYCEAAWDRADWSAPPEDVDLADLAYLLAGDCLLPLTDRQKLLEEAQPLRRLQLVCRLLTREAGFLSALRAIPAPPAELTGLSTPTNLN
ncbi:LON peptidase substrate-binding domain-containing protein [Amycolatopsis aidingensis]|uniref:LON peptidase substrate-binding domain-containing protein n=1 Tax=Amycolatopsis aidingensis TaxID=2842453 RepID=UPI001C0C5680|nr:LON peptidase substrate-binding domain-containing protein [Amycolatopsis aidingensis]